MQKKTPVEMERSKVSKITRSMIRLKHSINADEEINNTLPDRLAAFDKALQAGELKRLYVSLEDLLED